MLRACVRVFVVSTIYVCANPYHVPCGRRQLQRHALELGLEYHLTAEAGGGREAEGEIEHVVLLVRGVRQLRRSEHSVESVRLRVAWDVE